MVLIFAFALGGVYEVVVGSSGKTAVSGAFSAGPGTTLAVGALTEGGGPAATLGPASPPPTLPPGPCGRVPGAGQLARDLVLEFGIPVKIQAVTDAAASPAGGGPGGRCSTVTFTDARAPGVSSLNVYTNAATAATASHSSPDAVIVAANVTVELAPGLGQLRAAYSGALSTLTARLAPPRPSGSSGA